MSTGEDESSFEDWQAEQVNELAKGWKARVATLETERDQARKTAAEMHRRAQEAEGRFARATHRYREAVASADENGRAANEQSVARWQATHERDALRALLWTVAKRLTPRMVMEATAEALASEPALRDAWTRECLALELRDAIDAALSKEEP